MLHKLTYSFFTITLCTKYYYVHFIHEETESQSYEVSVEGYTCVQHSPDSPEHLPWSCITAERIALSSSEIQEEKRFSRLIRWHIQSSLSTPSTTWWIPAVAFQMTPSSLFVPMRPCLTREIQEGQKSQQLDLEWQEVIWAALPELGAISLPRGCRDREAIRREIGELYQSMSDVITIPQAVA